MKSFLIALPLLFLTSITAVAGTKDQAIQLNIQAGNVPEQIQIIQKSILEPEYVEMTQAERLALQVQLDILQEGQIDPATAALSQDKVNLILAKGFSDSRLVCRVERKIGSVMNKRVCRTMASMKEDHEATQRANAGTIQQ